MKENEEIVLIEDDEDKAQIIKTILRNHLGGNVRHIDDGEQAMNFLMSDDSKYVKLILLDLILPKVDGVEIFRRLKADPVKALIPVIILISSSQTEAYLTSLGLCPDGYVHKPNMLKACA
jgi:two-component system, response regulator